MASENENENRETVADVVAIVRRAAQYYEGEAEKSEGLLRESFKLSAANYREIANLVEAAAKRDEARAVEHATRHAEAVARDDCRDCVHNPKGKNYEGGNAAAMREALLKIRRELNVYCNGCTLIDRMSEDQPDYTCLRDSLIEIERIVDAALALPRRNCDVGTAEEQIDRHREWCNRDNDSSYCCNDCRDCFARWAQMPYEAEEGGAK